MRIQFWHIIVLLLLVLILFGANRLPDVASSVGKSLKIFKKEVSELREDDNGSHASPTATTPAAPGSHSTMPADRLRDEPPTGYDQPFPPGGSQPPLTPPDADPRRY